MKLEVSTRRFDRSSPKSTKPSFQFPPQSKSEPRNSFQASISFEKLLSEEGPFEPKMNGLIDLPSMVNEEHEILFETIADMEEEASTRETSSSTDLISLEKRTDQSDVTHADHHKTALLHGLKISDHAQTKSVKKENGKCIPPWKLLQKEKMQRFVSCNEKSAGGHGNHWSSSLGGKTLRRTTLSASSSPSFMPKNPSDKAECLTPPTSTDCRDVCRLSACEDGQASLSCPSRHRIRMKSSPVQWPEWGYESDPCLPPGFMSQLSDALPSRKTNKNTSIKTNEKTLAKVLTSNDEDNPPPNSSSDGEKEGRTPAWKKRIQWQSSGSKSVQVPGRTGKAEKKPLQKYIAVFKCDKLKGPAIFYSIDDADEYILKKDKNEREPAEWRTFKTFKEAEMYLERRKGDANGEC